MYKNQNLKIIFCIAAIFAGSLVFYFEGYKDIFFLQIFYIILISTGWLSLLIILWENNFFKNRKIKNLNKNAGLKFLIKLLLFAFAVGNLILISNLADQRVEEILNHHRFIITTATVIKFEERYSKTGSQHYAIINYNANNQIIKQAFYDYKKECSIDQKVKIKYAEEYPQMFAVLEILKKE